MTRQKMSANLESFTSGVRLVVGLHPEPSESPSHRSVQHDDAPGSQHVWIHQNNHLGPDGNQIDLCFLAFSALLWWSCLERWWAQDKSLLFQLVHSRCQFVGWFVLFPITFVFCSMSLCIYQFLKSVQVVWSVFSAGQGIESSSVVYSIFCAYLEVHNLAIAWGSAVNFVLKLHPQKVHSSGKKHPQDNESMIPRCYLGNFKTCFVLSSQTVSERRWSRSKSMALTWFHQVPTLSGKSRCRFQSNPNSFSLQDLPTNNRWS